MDNSNKPEFAKVFYAMGEFYDKKVSEELLFMYFDDLIELTIEEVKHGAKAHRQDPKHGAFFPKPADILRHLQTGKLSPEEQAEVAWAEVMQCLRKNGAYGGLKIENKQAIAAFKAFTTWKEFCAMDAGKLVWAKKEFISMYSTYDKTPLDMLPSSLPGLVELHNHKEKYVQIGAQSASDIMKTLAGKMKNK